MYLNNTISKYIGQKTKEEIEKFANPIRRLSVTENMPQNKQANNSCENRK